MDIYKKNSQYKTFVSLKIQSKTSCKLNIHEELVAEVPSEWFELSSSFQCGRLFASSSNFFANSLSMRSGLVSRLVLNFKVDISLSWHKTNITEGKGERPWNTNSHYFIYEALQILGSCCHRQSTHTCLQVLINNQPQTSEAILTKMTNFQASDNTLQCIEWEQKRFHALALHRITNKNDSFLVLSHWLIDNRSPLELVCYFICIQHFWSSALRLSTLLDWPPNNNHATGF